MKFELTGFAVLLSSFYSLRITCVPTELKRNMKFELTGFAVLLSSLYSLRITCVPTELKRNMKLTEKIKNGDP